MSEHVARPPVQQIQHVYNLIFHRSQTLSKLRDTISQGRVLHRGPGAIGVSGRSLAWKVLLLPADDLDREPLALASDEAPRVPIESLRSARSQFSALLLDKMRAPDGSYDESFVTPGLFIPKSGQREAVDLDTNNPLSLHEENPWKEWFAAVDLRKTIQLDVERTFPDMGYFRSEEVQHQLTNVLFLYSVMHPDIGYRQGMHELLAPLFYAIDFDSVSETSQADLLLAELCSRAWVAADSWALFCAVMEQVSQWYEWREPVPTPYVVNGPVNLKPYVLPIVDSCNRIQGTLLKSVDPLLYTAMQNVGVEPQLYGIRWLRLLFTREFPMDEAMMLWDELFASPIPLADLAEWVCVAMLIRIRSRLLPSDYSTQLTCLLRYPACPTPDSGAPHHITLLIRHATALMVAPNPSTGATLVMENRNMPVDVPDSATRRKSRQPERVNRAQTPEQSPPGTSLQLSFPELIARNLLDRGESLGINKTVMNAVSELKRNLPDLASTLTRTPSFATTSFSAYPLLDEKSPPEQRYARDYRSDLESARELAELRRQNQHLGEAVGWVLSILGEENESGTYQLQRKQVLESLAYVRDVLNGQVTEVDERGLWGEVEFKRRWDSRNKESPPPGVESGVVVRDARAGGGGTGDFPAAVAAKLGRPSNASYSSPASRETRRFSPTASGHGPQRSPVTSSGALVQGPTRKKPPQPLPLRTSGSNPFQRTLDGRQTVNEQTSTLQNQVQHDPLGVHK